MGGKAPRRGEAGHGTLEEAHRNACAHQGKEDRVDPDRERLSPISRRPRRSGHESGLEAADVEALHEEERQLGRGGSALHGPPGCAGEDGVQTRPGEGITIAGLLRADLDGQGDVEEEMFRGGVDEGGKEDVLQRRR